MASSAIRTTNFGLRHFLLLFMLIASPAAAQWDPATGHIKAIAGAGVPIFDPVPWNTAYKVAFRNVPFNGTFEGNQQMFWPYTPVNGINTLEDCFSEAVNSAPAVNVSVGACYYKNNTVTGDTFDFSVKRRGSAFSEANCYCYALNRFEGESCQPGFSHGGRTRQQYAENLNCDTMSSALIDDGAVPVSRQEALTGQPTKGHYVIMMARPSGTCVPGKLFCLERDFHLLRKDASGTWSWKLPKMPASDKDLEGNPITDPEAAPLPGHYLPCGYFKVEPDKMYLDPPSMRPIESGPLAPNDMVDVLRYKDSSVQVTVSPLPYNPDRDAETEPVNSKILAEDLAWERQRGTLKYKQWKADLAKALEQGTVPLGVSPGADTDATVASLTPSPAANFGQGTANGGADDDNSSPKIVIGYSSNLYKSLNPKVTTERSGAASPAADAVQKQQPSTGRRLKALL